MVSVKSELPAGALVAEIEICTAAEIGFDLYPELQPESPTDRIRNPQNAICAALMTSPCSGSPEIEESATFPFSGPNLLMTHGEFNRVASK
jgi:hypothetical protein